MWHYAAYHLQHKLLISTLSTVEFGAEVNKVESMVGGAEYGSEAVVGGSVKDAWWGSSFRE